MISKNIIICVDASHRHRSCHAWEPLKGETMSKKGQELVNGIDGKGARRVALKVVNMLV